jgi:PST family polysaccharide transporter
VVGGVVGVGMAFSGFGAWSLVGQQLVFSGVGAIVLWTASSWRPSFRFSKTHFVDLFSFGINIIGINLLNFLNRRSDDLLIGYFLGATALGYYTVAYRILLTLTDLLTSVTAQVAFPVFSRMQQDRERMLRAFYMGTKYASYIAFPIFIGLAVTASEVIPVVFGPQWTPSVPVMQVLAFIGLLHSVTFFNGGVIMAMGKPSWRLMLNAINAVTNVVAFLIAVRWGIVAVAAAYVIRGYVTAPITPWVIRKLIGLSFSQYLRQFAIPLAGSLALAASILLLHNLVGSTISPKVLLIMEVGLGAVVYLAAIQLMAPSMLQNVVGLARQVKTMKV